MIRLLKSIASRPRPCKALSLARLPASLGRGISLLDLGVQLEYTGDEALVFKDYLNQIIDLTSMQSIYRSMRGGVFPRSHTASDASAPTPGR